MATLPGLIAQASLALLARALPHLDPAARSGLARHLMQDRVAPRTRILAGFFDRATLAWKNKLYDIDRNGEEALLRRLAPFAPRVLIDAGANVGDWSRAAARHLPDAVVHAFEIVPDTAAVLRRNTAALGPRIRVNACGLADRAGEVEVFHSAEDSTGSSTSAVAFAVDRASKGITGHAVLRAPVTTGDAYLAAQGIERVDLLKIDVEGAEPAVLAGFDAAFARGAVTLVQVEYGPINRATRHFLADFHAFFAARGYVLGKLWPEGVGFAPYALEDEDFVGPNYVACRADRRDIIDAIACPRLTPL